MNSLLYMLAVHN